MKKDHKADEKQAAELLRKSLLEPASADFDDKLMKKIMLSAPPVRVKTENGSIKKAWIFLCLSAGSLLVSAAILAYFSGEYFAETVMWKSLTLSYVMYGGTALLVPLILYQFDQLLRVMFLNKTRSSLSV